MVMSFNSQPDNMVGHAKNTSANWQISWIKRCQKLKLFTGAKHIKDCLTHLLFLIFLVTVLNYPFL